MIRDRQRWTVDESKILSRREYETVLRYLKTKATTSINARQNLVIFRLACCCGLRASEIAGLRIKDVVVGDVERPYVYVSKDNGKGHKSRRVPLWWDSGTLADLRYWHAARIAQGAKDASYFVCSLARGSKGLPIHRVNIRRRFITSCRCLGQDRQQTITVHHGRHSFVSHGLNGRTIAEVQKAAGHSSIATTSIYTHIAVDDAGEVKRLFEWEQI